MAHARFVGLILAALAVPVGAVAPVARLVKDLDPGTEPFHLFVSRPAMAGGKAFFTANSQEFGAELWVSSGVASGTGRIADIYPGFRSSGADQMMSMGGKMFFSADDGTHGRELWVSDGTTAGTTMVADVFPGSGSSNPVPLATASGKLWFTAFTAEGPGLWCTDGTPANTFKINATPPSGPAPALLRPSHFSVLDGNFIFASDNWIWKSDGTSEGTVVIEEIPKYGDFVQVYEMALIGDAVYYVVSSDFREWLWRTNGQAGGAVMIPKEPGFESWQVLRGLLPVGGKVSFFAQSEGGPVEWYCGDGTLDGSVRFDNRTFKRFNEESCLVGDILYFGIENAARGAELYRSDGTLEGTYLVKDIRRGKGSAYPGDFQAAGKWLYFTADDGKKGREIWRTDGTSKGTRLVVETARGRDSLDPVLLTADGEALYFRDTRLWPFGDLWRTDGSKQGTVRLTVPEPKGLSGLSQALNYSPPIAALGNKVFFNARFSDFGIEPWTSDGTPGGTQAVGDTVRDGSADCQSMTRLGDRILYAGRSSAGITQVWASNGSMAGTVQLTNFPSGNERNFPGNFTVDGDRMFFSSGRVESALWVTDGTKRGTREIPMPGDTPFNILDSTPRMAGPALFFAHNRRPDNHEFWRSDGTPEGTVMLRDAFPLDEESSRKPQLAHFTALGNSICFFSKLLNSSRLWHSDGTAEGTLEVPVDPASGSFLNIAMAVPFGDRFLFLAEARNSGLKWWISDGTGPGTRILKNLSLTSPGFGSDVVPEHAVINGILYLGINTLAHGKELWRTDGSEEGTFMVADLFPGPVSSNPAGLQIHGNRLYFAATDPVRGRELWSSDGTAEGTGIVAEVMQGDRSSNPAMLCVAGEQLFFGAENPVAGFELHVLDLPDAGALASAATGARSAGIAGWTGQGSSVVPDGESLLRLAFNLDPGAPGRPVLDAGRGVSGYPSFTRASGVFRVEFPRRRDGRFSYVAKWSTALEADSFVPMTGPERIVEIDAEWERVTVEQVIAPGVTRMFGVVEVTEESHAREDSPLK